MNRYLLHFSVILIDDTSSVAGRKTLILLQKISTTNFAISNNFRQLDEKKSFKLDYGCNFSNWMKINFFNFFLTIFQFFF